MVAYHVAPRHALPKIAKVGLVPLVPGNPVYLFTDFTDAKLYAKRVEAMHGERFSILEIDVRGLELHKDYTLYPDDPMGVRNRTATAVYVNEPIPPSRIGMQDLRRKSQNADGSLYRRSDRRGSEVRVRQHRRRA